MIGSYLTTGIHNYFHTDILRCGETVQGEITFISPGHYSESLEVGMVINFQEGSKIIGYAEILAIYNETLKKQF